MSFLYNLSYYPIPEYKNIYFGYEKNTKVDIDLEISIRKSIHKLLDVLEKSTPLNIFINQFLSLYKDFEFTDLDIDVNEKELELGFYNKINNMTIDITFECDNNLRFVFNVDSKEEK